MARWQCLERAKRWAEVDLLPSDPFIATMNVVFAIGCRRYDDPDVAGLKYADRDAQRFAEVVVGAQDPGDTEIFLLHDEQKNALFRPTRGNILRFLSRGSRRDQSVELNNLFFFFSGHGFRSQHNDTDYLFASDSSVTALEDTAIPIGVLERYLRQWKAKHVLLFIDACRAAAEGGKSIAIQNRSKVDIDSLCPPGMVTFCSCRPGQASYEADMISSGVFTNGICRALGDEGQCTSIYELDTYLSDEIPKIARECGTPPQMPYSRVEPLAVQKLMIVSERMKKTRAQVTMGVRRVSDKVNVIDVKGELTTFAEGVLMDAYKEASDGRVRAIVLNFEGLEYMNSSGIGLLVTLLIRVNREKQRLLTYGLSEHYRNIFQITRLDDAIGIYDSEEEAIRAVDAM